jgi:hypothetical protein
MLQITFGSVNENISGKVLVNKIKFAAVFIGLIRKICGAVEVKIEKLLTPAAAGGEIQV